MCLLQKLGTKESKQNKMMNSSFYFSIVLNSPSNFICWFCVTDDESMLERGGWSSGFNLYETQTESMEGFREKPGYGPVHCSEGSLFQKCDCFKWLLLRIEHKGHSRAVVLMTQSGLRFNFGDLSIFLIDGAV